MKKPILFVFLLLLSFISLKTKAQSFTETEPNDNMSAAGVQTISVNGSYSGAYALLGDDDYWKIQTGAYGTITIIASAGIGTFNLVNSGGTSLFSITAAGTYTYVLDATVSYYIHLSGLLTSWNFSISGLQTAGAALNFTGNFVQKTSPFPLSSNWTVEAWIKPSSVGSAVWQTVLGQAYWSGGQGFIMHVDNNHVGIECPSTGALVDTTITAGVWTHVAATYGNGMLSFYKNGLLAGSVPCTYVNTSLPFYIGARAGNGGTGILDYFGGDMDEVRVWNTTRTGCQIQADMSCEIATSATGLLANYHFNEGVSEQDNTGINTLTDASTNGNHGVLNGFPLNGVGGNFFGPGGVVSGFTTASFPTATISVSGNTHAITNGATTTSGTDFTNFGNTGTITRTFVITNTATGTLNVGTPYFTGANASEFSVTTVPSETLASGASSSFVITFTPSTYGAKDATVNIFANDCGIPVFNYAIFANYPPAAALDFDGVNDQVVVTNNASLLNVTGSNFTFESWIKPTSNADDRTMVSKGPGNGGGSDGAYIFQLDAFNRLAFFNTPGNPWIYSTNTVTAGAWSHVAVTCDGSTLKFYINGQLDASFPVVTPTLNPGSGPMYIGRQGQTCNCNFFDGTLDEVRVWNVARSQCEIQTTMNSEIQTATGMVASYHFNQGAAGLTNTVLTLNDNSGNSCNGALSNFAMNGATSNWITPGGIVSGNTITSQPTATLHISGSSNPIPNGSTSTSAANLTDYGFVSVPTVRTYALQNVGTGTLYVNSITITGANAGSFSVTTPATGTLGTLGVTGVSITYTPSSTSTQTALVNVFSSDCTSPQYSFVISGAATPAAALNYNGVNNYLHSSNNITELGLNDFTIETWIKTTGINMGVISSDNENGSWEAGEKNLYIDGSGNLGFVGFGCDFVHGNTPVNDGNWHHIALTWQLASSPNGVAHFYVDGVDRTASSTYTANTANIGHFAIGLPNFNESVNYFSGSMDELRIWNVARSQCQIQTYMSCEIPGTATNLLANYHFNEGIPSGANTSVTVASDATGTNDLTLTNFSLTGSTSNWISPGSIVSGYTTTAAPGASINVKGNGVAIGSGNFTPQALNNTDFNGTATRTFVISNTNTGTLNITGVALSGINASEFSVTTLPTSSLLTGGSTASFVITFNGIIAGTRVATVNVTSSDCNFPDYNFAIQATPPVAECLNLDGSDDYVQFPNNAAAWSLGQEFSVEAWLKPNSLANQLVLFTGYGCAACPEWALTIGPELTCANAGSSGHIVFLAGGHIVQSANTATVSAWTHVTATYNGSVLKMYINGVMESSLAVTGLTMNPVTYCNIGADPSASGGCSPRYFYNGSIDEFRIWNKALCQAEVVNNMNCQITATLSQLTANYNFNEGVLSGSNSTVTVLTDASGNNVSGTLNGFGFSGSSSNWTGPGGVSSTSVCALLSEPDIRVGSGGTLIPSGAITPTASNGTDYGTAMVGGSPVTNTFVIANTGDAVLNLGSVNIIGGSPDYSVVSAPQLSIATGGSTSLVLAFAPTTAGVKPAQVAIGSDDCDQSAYTFTITGTGAAAGAALDFDGSDDQIVTNVSGTLSPLANAYPRPLTMEAWVYPASVSGVRSIIRKDGDYSFYLNGGFVGAEVFTSGGNGGTFIKYLATNRAVPTNTWTHVAAVWDGTVYTLYVNGLVCTTGTSSSTSAGTAALCIGISPIFTQAFAGDMDEIRIWNTARSQCQIESYMGCEIPTTATGLQMNLHLNQGLAASNNSTVNAIVDATGNVNGSLTNFALNGSASNWITPGSVVSGYTTVAAPSSSMSVTGNGNAIASGATTASTLNFTDFNAAPSRTFIINNSGGTLYINSYNITGAGASGFSISTVPSSSISGVGTTTLAIVATPTAVGTSTALVTINSSDCTSPTYSFVISNTPLAGAALDFDGFDDAVACGTGLSLTNQSLTVEFWARRTPNSGFNTVFSLGTGSTNHFLHAAFTGTNTFRFSFFSNDLDAVTTSASDGLYHHYACVFQPNAPGGFNRFIYIDGQLAAKDNSASNFTGSGMLNIGKLNGSSDLFYGSIDELRIWNVARTQCQIQSFMNSEIPTTATGLMANYHFNEGVSAGINTAVTTLTDATGSNNGTLTNFSLTGSSSNWVNPGGVTSGYTTTALPAIGIDVTGNGSPIAAGSALTNTTNFTDFGSATSRSYSIANTGTSTVFVSTITISGGNASDFSVTSLPSATISSSAGSSFSILFSPTAAGSRTAVVNISSNDCVNPTYSFVISATGAAGSALDFDGVDDNVRGPVVSSSTSSVTMEAWVKWGGGNGSPQIILYNGSISVNGYGLFLPVNSGLVYISISNLYSGPLNYSLTPSVWTKLTLEIENNNIYRLYANGVLASAITVSASVTPTGSFCIGSNSSGTQGFKGQIDEVRFWNRLLSHCETQTYMSSEIATTAPGLTANYHFNEGIASGLNTAVTTLTDAAGSNNCTLSGFNLTGTASNWVSPGGVVSGSTTPAVVNSSVSVSGNGNAVANGATATSTNNFTDFGSASSRNFVVTNAGSSPLYIDGVTLSGANASDFSVASVPPASSSVAPAASANFIISFSATAVGTRSAIVTVTSNDCAVPNYSFVISSSVSPASALDFDGVNDYITRSETSFGTGDMTIELWVKPNSFAQESYLVSNRTSESAGPGYWYVLSIQPSSGVLQFQTGEGNLGVSMGLFTPPLSTSTWQHVAITRSATTFKLYVNGVEKASGTDVGVHDLTSQSGFNTTYIGAWTYYSQRYFNGNMDELRIWNVARTQCELQTYMNAEIASTAPGLIANYHFNEGVPSGSNTAVTTLTDATGSNNGTLTNFALTSGTLSNWINPGGVVSGFTTTAQPTATIQVTGNSTIINNNAAGTSTLDFTDFNGASSSTFVITNTGTSALTLGPPVCTNSQFSISVQPATTVPAGSSSSFVVVFTPTAGGLQSSRISIGSNDCNTPIFKYTIQATSPLASALAFDGSDDVVNVADNSSFHMTHSLSIEAWVKTNSATGTVPQYIFSKDADDGVNGQYGLVLTNNSPQFHFFNGAGIAVNANYTLTPGVWTHIAGTWDGAMMNIYINGTLRGSATYTGTLPTNTNNIVIGNMPLFSYPLNGSIDELRIWNTGRTQCEVLTYMNAEITTASGLVANYHFNEGSANLANPTATALIDATGTNSGTLTNFAMTGILSNWASPGGVANGFTTTTLPATLNIQGNGNTIPAGNATTSSTDFTDFGTAASRTFVAQNASSSATLYVNSVTLSGANASDFSVTTLPASGIAASGSSNFVITFSPTAIGTRSAIVTVSSADCTSPNYSFAITASATPASALSFDGTNDYVQLPPLAFPSNKMTVEAWIKPNNITTNSSSEISRQEDTPSPTWIFSFQNNGTLLSYGLTTDGSYTELQVPINASNYTDGNWHHVAAVYDGNYKYIYSDGILIGQEARTGTLNVGTSTLHFIGASVGLEYFNGLIDEVRYWDAARTQCELQTYMTAEIPTTAAGLIANYHFNQGIPSGPNTAVTALADAAGANTGTLTNFALTGTVSNWVTPGVIANGATLTSVPAGSLLVTGNGNNILNGSVTTSTTNFSDFGSAPSRTFVANNAAGSGTLYVNTVALSGANASDFSVTSIPTSTAGLLAGGSANFVISFSATALGTRSAVVTVGSSDCSAPGYSFVITASATPASALSFDGSDDYIQLNDPNFGTSDFTVEMWAKINSFALNTYLLSTRTNEGGLGNYWDLGISGVSPGHVYMETADDGTTPLTYTQSATALNTGTWYHIAVVRSGLQMSIYINGILEGGITYPSITNLVTGNNSLRVSGSGAGLALIDGTVDEVRLWNVARSQCQIQEYMNCEIPTTATGLIGNYHFNEGLPSGSNTAVTSLTDATGINTGTLNLFALTGSSSNWVSPGGVVSGYTTALASTASLAISGNGNSISNGATTTGTLNFTDFGPALVRTYSLQNTGSGTLYINSVHLSGANASEFSVTAVPASSIAGSSQGAFDITFAPASLGSHSAIVTVNSSDCTSPDYSFVITSSVSPASALSFDGSDDQVTLPAFNFTSTSVAMEGWFYVSGLQVANAGLIFQRGCSTCGVSAGLNIASLDNTRLGYTWADGQYGWTGGPVYPLNTWFHAALVVEPNQATIYLNGVPYVNTATHVAQTFSGNTLLGRDAETCCGNRNFSGLMDEVRIWNAQRTACDIETNMNAEISATAPGLIANYHFNQGIPSGSNTAVTTLTDATGSLNGALNNFALTGTVSNWVSPGSVANNYTVTSAPAASLAVTGNGNAVNNGATATSTNNFTAFDAVSTHTFVTTNAAGSGTLYISAVSLSGANASEFSVTAAPSPSSGLLTGASASFVISFSPTALGTRSAIVTVGSNDCSLPNYSFVITGSVSPASALSFDGVDDNVTAPAISLNNRSFTIEFWAKPNGITNRMVVGQGSSIGTNQSLHLGFMNSGMGSPFLFDFYSNSITYTTSATTDGLAHHWACVYDNSLSGINRFLYLDGVLVASDHSAPLLATGSLIIGDAAYGGNDYSGWLDELRVWTMARTQCEIQTYMNCEIATTASSLAANYHFNQGVPSGSNTSVTTLIDATGVNNGTLTGFALTGGTVSNWVSPGGVVNDYTITAAPAASLAVTGNGNAVNNGATATSTNNFTDFGSASTRTFAATNAAGGGTLYINAVTLSGANAGDFSLTTAPSSTTGLSASASANIVISFSPTALGTRSAVVTVASNDCSIPNYSFVITATTTPAAALNFNGVNNYISSVQTVNGTSGTWEAWIKKADWTDHHDDMLFSNGIHHTSGAGSFYVSLHPSAGLHFRYGSDLETNNYYIGNVITQSLPANSWHHVAATWNTVSGMTTTKLYLDGNMVASGSGSITIPVNTGTIYLGGGGDPLNPYFGDGDMDEVRIWNTERTQCQIQTYMGAEIPATAAGLLANYHFNQGIPSGSNTAVTTLTDAAGSNTGTLNSFTLTGTSSNWISPGAIPSGYTVSSAPAASLAVTGNGNAVNNGATATSTNNFTDFGSVYTRTFAATNAAGSGTLYIDAVSLSGANAADFSVITLPSSTSGLLTGASANFVISFSPTALGTYSAVVNVVSNDCSAADYSFVISASVSPASALNFDGTDDAIAAADPSFGTSDLTVEAWIKVDPNTGGILVTSRTTDQGPAGNWWSVNCDGFNGTFGIELADNTVAGSYTAPVTPAGSLLPGAWQHIAWVRSGANNMLYLNGILMTEFSDGFTRNYNTNDYMGLGAWINNGAGFFSGSMDELRLWNVARTQCQLLTYMNAEIPSTAPGLLANYHFNEGIPSGPNAGVTTLTDVAGSNNGTLNNGFALSGASSNWISPGAVANGFTTTVIPTASIQVSGNGSPIANGSAATSTLNFTDFGSAFTRTFAATNAAGSGTLYVNNVLLSGANASDFTVTSVPASTTGLTSSASSSFVIDLTPTALGTRSAIVTVASSDCSTPNYSFVISASVSPASALRFDGVDNYVDIPSSNMPSGNNDYTVEFWTKLNAAQSGQRWIAYWGQAATPGLMCTIGFDGSDGNKIRIHHYGPDAEANTASLTLGAWTHVAVTYHGATTTNDIYINGTYIESLNFGVPLSIPSNPELQLGTYDSNAGYQINADLDEFRVWSIARTQCEIQTYMNAEISTTAPNLLINYHFNEGVPSGSNTAVTTLTDAAGTNTGTLNSFTLTGSVSNWVSPGGVPNGYTTAVAPTATVQVSGNGHAITNGSMATSTTNATDFGGACLNGNVLNTYTVANAGTSVLSINTLTITGTDAALFTLTPLPATLAAGNSATFAIAFSTTAGISNATVNFATNDCANGNFVFAITGSLSPTPSVAVSGGSVCPGGPFTLTPSGADTYTYSGGSAVVNPTITTTYSVTGTSSLGCMTASAALVTVTVTAPPAVAIAATNTVCSDNSATFTASGADTYTWNTGATGSVAVFSPSVTTAYTVTGTDALGCTNFASQTLTVYANPTVSVNDATICPGDSFTIAPSGAATYSYLNGGPVVSPTLTSTYSVTGTSSAGCTGAPSMLTVSLATTPTVSVSDYTICSGSSATLAPGGAVSYTYEGGSATVNPTITTTYTIMGANAAGCTNTTQSNVNVDNAPSLTITASDNTLCIGGSVTLTATGSTSYTWDSGANNSSIAVSPTATTVYTVNSASSGGGSCVGTSTIAITVNPLPTITVNSGATCPGGDFTLTPSGAATYTYSSGSAVVTPTDPITSYSVTGTSSFGCDASTSAVATVSLVNTVTVAVAGNTTICNGQSATLTASGATTYTWSNGVLTDSVVLTPTTTASYTVDGASGTCSNTAVVTVSVNDTPTINVSGGSVCAGSSFTLNPSGAVSYTYSGGSAVVTPTGTSQSYSVAGTGTNGCVSTTSAVATITVDAAPAPTITAASGTICAGETLTLTTASASTYTWSDNSTASSLVITPTATSVYSVIVTSSNSCSGSGSIAITVNPLPTITVNGGATCPGNSFTLTPSGAATYTYSGGSAVVTPTDPTTTYSVTGTSLLGCDASASAVATVSVVNTVTVAVSGNSTICNGQSATLTASGATTYTWSNGVLTDSVVLTPTTTTSYTVDGASGTCSNTAVVTVSVNDTPTINVSGGSVCAGSSFTLNPSGAVSYTYSGGSAVVTPTGASQSYSVAGTGTNGCVSTTSAVATITVDAAPAPTITAPSGTICAGETLTLTTASASTYTWSDNSTASSLVITPTATSVYSVIVTSSNSCSGSGSIAITVNPLPTITVNGGATCPGNSFTLTPGGASTYTYSGGSAVVTPTAATTTYSVIGTSSLGCVASTSAVATVSVVNTVTLAVSGNTTICNGQTTTLTASGATTYSWNTGVLTNTIALTPTTTSSYTIYGVSGSCSNSAIVSVSVNATPSISVNSGSVCAGNAFTLNPSGANSYTYSGGSAIVTPTGTSQSYSVTGTDLNGCISSTAAVSTITVNALPVLTVVSTGSICEGASANLTVSGAASYTWNTSAVTNTISEIPAGNTTYSVDGTDANGCVGSASQLIVVNPLPTITVNGSAICPGNSFTLTPSGAASYTYSNGSAVVTPTAATTNYSVTGTSSLGCVSSTAAVATVSLVNTLSISVSGNTTVCEGQTATLTASGASTYSWSNSVLTDTVVLTPTATTSYTVEGSSGSCSNTAVVTVSVNPAPGISVSNGSVCAGASFTLSPGGAVNYTYSGGSAVVNPSITTNYTITGEDANGCTTATPAIVTVSVISAPALTVTASSSLTCPGSTLNLTASGASTYTWSTNASSASIAVTPSVNSDYSVTGTDANGCTDSGSITVNVYTLTPIQVNIADTTICLGDSLVPTLSPVNAYTYTWSGGLSTNVAFTPTISSTYTVTGIDLNGCQNTAIASVSVNTVPVLTVSIDPDNVCSGDSVHLSITGATTYSWLTGGTTSLSATSGSVITVHPTMTNNTYTVEGLTTGSCNSLKTFSVDVHVCYGDTITIDIPTGITPNGDGLNDWWHLRNMEYHHENAVAIFDRWGIEIANIKYYDNNYRKWPTEEQARKLTPGTYFYIIDPGDGAKVLKGWVEVVDK